LNMKQNVSIQFAITATNLSTSSILNTNRKPVKNSSHKLFWNRSQKSVVAGWRMDFAGGFQTIAV